MIEQEPHIRQQRDERQNMQPWDVYGSEYRPESGLLFEDWMAVRSNRLPASSIDFGSVHSSDLGKLAVQKLR